MCAWVTIASSARQRKTGRGEVLHAQAFTIPCPTLHFLLVRNRSRSRLSSRHPSYLKKHKNKRNYTTANANNPDQTGRLLDNRSTPTYEKQNQTNRMEHSFLTRNTGRRVSQVTVKMSKSQNCGSAEPVTPRAPKTRLPAFRESSTLRYKQPELAFPMTTQRDSKSSPPPHSYPPSQQAARQPNGFYELLASV